MGSGKSTLLAAAVSIASLASTWQPALASTSYSVHSFAAASYDGVSPCVDTLTTSSLRFCRSAQGQERKRTDEAA